MHQFDHEDTVFKKEFAESLAAKDDFEKAAKVLEKINTDQSDKSSKEKVEIWLMIAENWFEVDEAMYAEGYVNKAAHLMREIDPKSELQTQYKCFAAKVLDSKRSFNLAAWKYYAVSNLDGMEATDVEAMLRCAMTCAILSPAGDKKYKIMNQLHKDERGREIDPHYELLDKLFRGKIIK